LIELSSGLIGTNTALPNAFVGAVLAAGLLSGVAHVKCTPEAPLGILRNSRSARSDFLLETVEGARIWVEVKNNHLVYPDRFAYFPDSVSERATEHLEALATKVAAGDRAVVVFLVQRGDATGVRPSDVHDPVFAAAARRVAALGVEFRALAAVPELTRAPVEAAHLRLIGEIPVDLAPYATAPVAAFQSSLRAEAPAWVRGARKVPERSDAGDGGRPARTPKRPKSR
jgi:sugar fermentation stimulation protein A